VRCADHVLLVDAVEPGISLGRMVEEAWFASYDHPETGESRSAEIKAMLAAMLAEHINLRRVKK
jgi:hypothetical protein